MNSNAANNTRCIRRHLKPLGANADAILQLAHIHVRKVDVGKLLDALQELGKETDARGWELKSESGS